MNNGSFCRHADLPRVEESPKDDLGLSACRWMILIMGLTLLAASLRSAPGRTIAGHLPPSSITDGLRLALYRRQKDVDPLEMLSAEGGEFPTQSRGPSEIYHLSSTSLSWKNCTHPYILMSNHLLHPLPDILV